MKDQETLAREAIRLNLPGMKRSLSKDGSRQFFRQQLEIQNLDRVIGAARQGNADALAILREHARGARRSGMNVPDDFHAFVWECFIDGPPKAPPGPKPQDTLVRDMIIVALVKVLSEEFGLKPHRNKEFHDSKTSPFSACAIVAQEMGLTIGEKRVEEIWDAGKADVGL